MSVFVDTLLDPVIEGIEENCTTNTEKIEVLDRIITSLQWWMAELEATS